MGNKIGRQVTEGEPQLWVGCLACYNEGFLAGFWIDAVVAPTSMTGGDDDNWWTVTFRLPGAETDAREVQVKADDEDDARYQANLSVNEPALLIHTVTQEPGEPHWNALVDEKATPVSEWHYSMGHEELWVMDHEGFHGLLKGECSPDAGRKLGEAIAAMKADDVDPEAFAAYWTNRHGDSVEGLEWDGPTRSAFEEAYKGVHKSEQDYIQDLYEESYAEELESLPSIIKGHIDWEGVTRDSGYNSDSWTAPASAGGVHVFDV